MTDALKLGKLSPFEDQRRYNFRQGSEKGMDADAFLCFMYTHVAEPLADADEDAVEASGSAHRLLEYVFGSPR